MVNLLFISNNIKIQKIKTIIQPLFKLKIDVVTDFDLGLKEVFEKRPATVFIQDQIAGVSGESVARHIQMLLGTSAPSFVFMYEGSTKAKQVKGLFEYLIDLSPTEVKIVEVIQVILKSLLGPEWDKIYILPKLDTTAVENATSQQGESRDATDQLLDDILTDLDNSGSILSENISKTNGLIKIKPADELFHVVSSPHDQLSEMLSETSTDTVNNQASTVMETDVKLKKLFDPENVTDSNLLNYQSGTLNRKVSDGRSISDESRPQSRKVENVSVAPVPPVSPADFVIVAESPTNDVAPEDLLRVFEGNYHSKTLARKRYVAVAVILIMCSGGILFYLFKQTNFLQQYLSRKTVKSAVVIPAVQPTESTGIVAKKSVLPPVIKPETLSMPSFIPQAGEDRSFASLKPGWERYVDSVLEFRMYRASGKIKAIQVVALKNNEISEPKMKSILFELLGDGEYVVKSREKKHGYDITRAIIGSKADLLLYRKNSILRAFVVSLN